MVLEIRAPERIVAEGTVLDSVDRTAVRLSGGSCTVVL